VIVPVLKPVSVPLPPLVIVMNWLAGSAAPWTAEKVRLVEDNAITGDGGTVNVTVRVCGLLDAMPDCTGIVADGAGVSTGDLHRERGRGVVVLKTGA
jgi:hypothetical protein